MVSGCGGEGQDVLGRRGCGRRCGFEAGEGEGGGGVVVVVVVVVMVVEGVEGVVVVVVEVVVVVVDVVVEDALLWCGGA